VNSMAQPPDWSSTQHRAKWPPLGQRHLSAKITVDVRGEILQLKKKAINTDGGSAAVIAAEVTRGRSRSRPPPTETWAGIAVVPASPAPGRFDDP